MRISSSCPQHALESEKPSIAPLAGNCCREYWLLTQSSLNKMWYQMSLRTVSSNLPNKTTFLCIWSRTKKCSKRREQNARRTSCKSMTGSSTSRNSTVSFFTSLDHKRHTQRSSKCIESIYSRKRLSFSRPTQSTKPSWSSLMKDLLKRWRA